MSHAYLITDDHYMVIIASNYTTNAYDTITDVLSNYMVNIPRIDRQPIVLRVRSRVMPAIEAVTQLIGRKAPIIITHGEAQWTLHEEEMWYIAMGWYPSHIIITFCAPCDTTLIDSLRADGYVVNEE